MPDCVPQVLKKVMQHEIAESFFNDPVNPDALGIPEYREIVQVISQLKQLGRVSWEWACLAALPLHVKQQLVWIYLLSFR